MGKGGTMVYHEHTKDCAWKNETINYSESDSYQKMRMEDQEWSDEDIWDRKVDAQSKNIQRLLILQNQLDVLMTTSDIAFDSGSQLESKKIQAEIDDLMGKSTKGDNSNINNDIDG
jgi:hypothetical protein